MKTLIPLICSISSLFLVVLAAYSLISRTNNKTVLVWLKILCSVVLLSGIGTIFFIS